MDTPSTSVRDLARRLLALEAARVNGADPETLEAFHVWEKLRISLTRFAGSDGFTSLMRRALSLARADVPSLQVVTLKPGGSPEALQALAADARERGPDAASSITANLLGLLVTFIGESLTLRLVREAWPEAALES